jgi:2,3-dihydroxybenzoate-AMP ligase
MIPAQQIWPPEFAERYRWEGYWKGETLGGLLRERAAAAPSRTAVIADSERWTYEELDARADALASGFRKLGLRPGDRALLQLPNIPQFLSVVFGLFRAGILPVFTLPAHRSSEIIHFARASEASAYIIPDSHDGFDYRNLAASVSQVEPSLRHIIVAGEPGPFISLADLEANAGASSDLYVASPSEVAFFQLSGGSTGLSKLIPRTHDDYSYSFRASAEICGLDASSVYLGVLSIAHNFPMSSPGFFGTIYAGGTIALSPSPSPDKAFPIIEREKVTITSLVPPLLLVWLQAAANTKYDLSSLKLLQVGGAKLTPEVARRVKPTFGVTLQQVFGMAEGLVNYTRLDDPEEIIVTTQGRPISPDDEILILADDGAPVPEGRAGHLLTRGPYTIRGYHNAPEANARAFTEDGYYRTGDIVSREPGGYLVVRGRATDQINRGGEKVSAEEVEDHLLAHPQVYDAAVVSLPDPYLGERSCAFVIASGEKPKPGALKVWIRSRGLAEYKVPDQIVFFEEFPATGVGKTSRVALRETLRQRLIQGTSVEESN